MRILRWSLFLLICPCVLAQSAPQLARDYVRGPGGKLAVTIEPDYYPPTSPYPCTASGGPCAINGIDVAWSSSTDIGSGVAGYYGPGGFTTGFSYHDSDVYPEQCYSYQVTAVDNVGHESDPAYSNTVCIDLCMEDAFAGLFVPRERLRSRGRFARVRFLAANMRVPGGVINRRSAPWVKMVERPKPLRSFAAPAPRYFASAGGAL